MSTYHLLISYKALSQNCNFKFKIKTIIIIFVPRQNSLALCCGSRTIINFNNLK